jgi:acetyl-CoA synthetase
MRTPEPPPANTLCARAGFSAESLADRLLDSRPSVVITASAAARANKPLPLKGIVDAALARSAAGGHAVAHCLVLDHGGAAAPRAGIPMKPGRDVWWDDAVLTQPTACPVEWMDAEAPLFKLYTSGSTGASARGPRLAAARSAAAAESRGRRDDLPAAAKRPPFSPLPTS